MADGRRTTRIHWSATGLCGGQRRKGQPRLSHAWAEERPGRMRHGRRGRALNMDGHQSRPPHHNLSLPLASMRRGVAGTIKRSTCGVPKVALVKTFGFFLPKFLFVFSSFSAQISTKFHRNSREIRQICVKITVLMGRNFEFQEKVPKSRKSFYETCQSCVLKSVSGSRNFEFRKVEPKSHRNFRLAPTLPNLGKNFAKV